MESFDLMGHIWSAESSLDGEKEGEKKLRVIGKNHVDVFTEASVWDENDSDWNQNGCEWLKSLKVKEIMRLFRTTRFLNPSSLLYLSKIFITKEVPTPPLVRSDNGIKLVQMLPQRKTTIDDNQQTGTFTALANQIPKLASTSSFALVLCPFLGPH